ncbi:TolC family protein [Chryseobacterium sp.]|uniref:TolC family protein n=1 Tax=Chryseobacterium sp. TaxID=1871047 RepID=UPI0035B282AA
MKRLNHRNILYGMAALSLVSCAVPKVAELKKAQELPEEFIKTDKNKSPDEFQQINLKAYFTDPYLLELFDKVVQANPDFQIAQQRVEIANSFLQRSKMDLLPSLEVGIEASGNRYGKYTMEGVGNYDTNLSPNITEDQKSTGILRLITGWAQEAAGKLMHGEN